MGSPDFLRASQQSFDPLLSVANVSAAPTKTYGPFSVAIWPAIGLLFTPTDSAAEWDVTVSFYGDQAKTQLLGQTVWRPNGLCVVSDYVGCFGPWVTITVSLQHAGATNLFSLVVVPQSQVGSRSRQSTGPLLAVVANTVNAGTTLSTEPDTWMMGAAFFHFDTSVAVAGLSVSLQFSRTGGVAKRYLYRLLQTTDPTFFDQLLCLDGEQCQLSIHNASGTPVAVNAILVPQL